MQRKLSISHVKHGFFWLCYTIFWGVVSYEQGVKLGQLLLVNLFFLVGHVGAAYTGIYVLLPRYFDTKRYVWLVVLFLSNVAFFAFLIAGGMSLSLVLYGESSRFIWQGKTWFTKFFLSTFWIAAVFLAWKTLIQRRKVEQQNHLLQQQKLETELHFLKAQLNPHFLFNALNSIYFQVAQSQDEAQASILTFSEMLRYQLYECASEQVSLQKELDYLQNYLAMEQLRQGERLQIHTTIEVDDMSVRLAPLLFLPLIENACKYVSREREKDNFIRFLIRVHQQQLFFSIENTRSTYVEISTNKGGIGQQNLQRRLELIYPQCHRLTLQQNPQTYIAILEIDLRSSIHTLLPLTLTKQ